MTALEIINALDALTNDENGRCNTADGIAIPDSLFWEIYNYIAQEVEGAAYEITDDDLSDRYLRSRGESS